MFAHQGCGRPSLYLDTTVPSAYLDARAPDRQRLTVEFWNARIPDFHAFVSTLTLAEVNDTPDPAKRAALGSLVAGFEVLALTEDADALAHEYLRRGLFPDKYSSDASHVAIAAVARIGYLVSWNFTHLVKVRVRREVNLVNALMGYDPIEILAPPEL